MQFNFDAHEPYVLQNQRVLLRPLQHSDEGFLMPFALNEPTLWTYSLQSAAGYDAMKHYINHAISNRSIGIEYPFVVFDKLTNQYAGSTRFYDIQPRNLSLQLGYTWYGSSFWGTGLNKNCKFLMLEFAFEHIGAERVEFRADADNARSIAAMKSIGCTLEGVLRSHAVKANGVRRSSAVLSILKNEWFAHVKPMLAAKL